MVTVVVSCLLHDGYMLHGRSHCSNVLIDVLIDMLNGS